MKTDKQEDQFYRYLLGVVAEAEQLGLEKEFLSGGDAFERVWEIENELVDRYVRGRLTADEKRLFEQNYLLSPVHRERVAVARNLIEAADSGAERKETQPSEPWTPWRPPFMASFSRNPWRWAAIATILLLAVASVGLLSERARLHQQISQLEGERASEHERTQELQKEMAGEREQNDKLIGEIERLHVESRNTESPSQIVRAQDATRAVFSFLLSPMLMRSGGEAQHLKVPKDAAVIVLQMQVHESDAIVFQVALRTVEGAQIWSKPLVKTRKNTGNSSLVSVSIPSNKLGAGDYILTLSATRGAEETEEINRYFFRVAKQ